MIFLQANLGLTLPFFNNGFRGICPGNATLGKSKSGQITNLSFLEDHHKEGVIPKGVKLERKYNLLSIDAQKSNPGAKIEQISLKQREKFIP